MHEQVQRELALNEARFAERFGALKSGISKLKKATTLQDHKADWIMELRKLIQTEQKLVTALRSMLEEISNYHQNVYGSSADFIKDRPTIYDEFSQEMLNALREDLANCSEESTKMRSWLLRERDGTRAALKALLDQSKKKGYDLTQRREGYLKLVSVSRERFATLIQELETEQKTLEEELGHMSMSVAEALAKDTGEIPSARPSTTSEHSLPGEAEYLTRTEEVPTIEYIAAGASAGSGDTSGASSRPAGGESLSQENKHKPNLEWKRREYVPARPIEVDDPTQDRVSYLVSKHVAKFDVDSFIKANAGLLPIGFTLPTHSSPRTANEDETSPANEQKCHDQDDSGGSEVNTTAVINADPGDGKLVEVPNEDALSVLVKQTIEQTKEMLTLERLALENDANDCTQYLLAQRQAAFERAVARKRSSSAKETHQNSDVDPCPAPDSLPELTEKERLRIQHLVSADIERRCEAVLSNVQSIAIVRDATRPESREQGAGDGTPLLTFTGDSALESLSPTCRQILNTIAKPSQQLLSRLKLEFPNRPIGVLEFDAKLEKLSRAIKRRRAALEANYSNKLQQLELQRQQALTEETEEAERRRDLQTQMKTLRDLRAGEQLRMRLAQAALALKMDREQLEKMTELTEAQIKEEAEQLSMNQYREKLAAELHAAQAERALLDEKARQQAAAIAREQKLEQERRRAYNEKRLAARAQLDAQHKELLERQKAEKARAAAQAQARLEALRMSVAGPIEAKVTRDPERVVKATEAKELAEKARAEEEEERRRLAARMQALGLQGYASEKLRPSSRSKPLDGFTVDQLRADPRYRLSEALSRAGISSAQSAYARQLLLDMDGGRRTRPDMKQTFAVE